jgi:hypothetical protein
MEEHTAILCRTTTSSPTARPWPMSATSAAAAWSLGIDDTVEAIRARLCDYHAKTRPVLDLFGPRGW